MVETNGSQQRVINAKEEVIEKLEAVSAEQDCEQKKEKLYLTMQTAADLKTSVLEAEPVATQIDVECSAVLSDVAALHTNFHPIPSFASFAAVSFPLFQFFFFSVVQRHTHLVLLCHGLSSLSTYGF